MTDPRRAMTDRLSLWQIDAIGLAVCALLAGVWYLAGVEPLSQARAARASLDASLAEKSAEADHVRSVKADTERLLASIRTQIQEDAVQLQSVDALTHRVADLTQLARGHALRLDEIKPGAAVSGSRFTVIPIRVTGGGTYVGCVAFLTTLHEKYPDVGLSSMDLRGEPDMPERGARFTFDLVWYAAPPAAAAKK